MMVFSITLHAQYYNWEPRVSDNDLKIFLDYCLSRAGADTMITPREIIRDYTGLLNVLLQNPEAKFAGLVGSATLSHADDDDSELPDDVPPPARKTVHPSDINAEDIIL